jgi:hypothetical protein
MYRLDGRVSSLVGDAVVVVSGDARDGGAFEPATLGALDAGPALGSTYGFMLRWEGNLTGVSTLDDVELCAKRCGRVSTCHLSPSVTLHATHLELERQDRRQLFDAHLPRGDVALAAATAAALVPL